VQQPYTKLYRVYCLWAITRYWFRTANFLYPTCTSWPHWTGGYLEDFAMCYKKPTTMGLYYRS